MAFMTMNTSQENVQDWSGDGSNFINKSGFYEVVIKAAIVDVTQKGSQHINLWVDYNGQDQMLFQAIRLTNTDGSPNLGQQLFTKLYTVLGGQDGGVIAEPVSKQLPIGAKGAEKEAMVLEEFTDQPVIIRIQMEYSLYEGKIQEKKLVRNVFRVTDKATAAEIVNAATPGEQYNKEAEFADQVKYDDGLTEEDVKKWKADQKANRGKITSDNKPTAGFGGKKFGAK